MEHSFVIVTGFFSSGSSAAVDLLKEFEGSYECEAEIKIIEDPYGIHQLEYNLTDGWDLLTSAAAARDFLWLCRRAAKKASRFPLSYAGLGYRQTINPDFLKISEEYVKELSAFQYRSDFYYQKFKKNYFHYVIDRCRFGLEYYSKGKLRAANRNGALSYFANPTKEEFYAATKRYFNRLYQPAFDYGAELVILDQAVSILYPQKIHDYFDRAKMIIVDRDPRDMYVEDVAKWGENLDDDTTSRDAGLRYVTRHRALRQNRVDDPDVLYLNFEDIVLDYETTKQEICDFVGLDPAKHLHPRTHLIPEQSQKNIGIWQRYRDRYGDALDAITEQLPEFCRSREDYPDRSDTND